MGEWKCNHEVIMCSIKEVQTSFCTKPKPSFKYQEVTTSVSIHVLAWCSTFTSKEEISDTECKNTELQTSEL